MLMKLAIVAVLAVGVLGRTVPEDDSFINSIANSDYCEQDKIQQVKSSMSTFKQCLDDTMTDHTFQLEIRQAAISNNSSRTVKAFCGKSSQIKTCVRTLLTSMTPCFTTSGLRTTQKGLETVLDFICANDGAKMILFLKEGGKECMEEKSLNFALCKSTKISNIKRLVDVYGTGPAVPEKERCKIDKQNDACALAAIKTCSNPIPGQLAEELINAIHTNCDDENQDTGSSTERPTEV